MRIAVTGQNGQIARALIETGGAAVAEIIPLARPAFDLLAPETIAEHLTRLRADALISAAAYTAVDQAETEPEVAEALNARAPGVLARACAEAGIPMLHLSTDYVFDGTLDRPYREKDVPAPTSVYGRTKLAGEEAVRVRLDRHVILRTAWVYAAQGRNFVNTMLRLAQTRETVRVVADQHGCPSYAPDIAAALIRIAQAVKDAPAGDPRFGTFHLTGAGETNWAGFAEAIFSLARAHELPAARVEPITTAEYPTPARRPANSRLDGSKLARIYGIRLPAWSDGLAQCMARIVAEAAGTGEAR